MFAYLLQGGQLDGHGGISSHEPTQLRFQVGESVLIYQWDEDEGPSETGICMFDFVHEEPPSDEYASQISESYLKKIQERRRKKRGG